MSNNDTYLNLAHKVPYIKNYAENGLVKEIGPTPAPSPIILSNARNKDLVSLTAYGYCSQDGTPTPAAPIDIVCNNGVLKHSPNIFDEQWLENQAITAAGQQVEGNGRSCSGFIPVMPGATYTWSSRDFTRNLDRYYFLYKDTTTFKSYIHPTPSTATEYTITIPSDVKYIRLQEQAVGATLAGIKNQLEPGSTATPYMPYGQIYTDGTVETIWVHSKNLFDKTTITANRYINASGTVTSDGTNKTVVSDKIYVKPSTTYTLSGVGNIYDATYSRSGFQYQADNTPISAIAYTERSGKVTFTTAANCAYIRVMSLTKSVDTAMLEQGSTATTYEPYFDCGTATAEMLLKVGDYQDVQSIIDGVVTRNVRVKVLKGDSGEGWQSGTDANINTYYYMSLQDLVAGVDGKCTHFTYNPNDTTNGYFVNDTDTLKFCPANNSSLGSVSDWTTWLAANTPILVYPIANPTNESVSAQQISTQIGDNTLTVSADSGILEVSAKYKGGR